MISEYSQSTDKIVYITYKNGASNDYLYIVKYNGVIKILNLKYFMFSLSYN